MLSLLMREALMIYVGFEVLSGGYEKYCLLGIMHVVC
jgi:hypothetical protein